MVSVAGRVAASAIVRDYVACLRSLVGKTVAARALLPSWQSKTDRQTSACIPGSPRERASSRRWVVRLATRWRAAGLGACVDVELVREEGHRWVCGERVGTLARVWVRGHLVRVERTR
jgi:hypothetical protein